MLRNVMQFFLSMNITELLADPNNERYTVDLNIGGTLNSEDENNGVDIILRNMIPRGGNFFRVEDGPNGIRLKLIRSVDRDVSLRCLVCFTDLPKSLYCH